MVECKVRRGDLERTVAEGLAQTRGYVDRCRAEAGHLIVFDRSAERTWEEKIFAGSRPRTGRRSPSGAWELHCGRHDRVIWSRSMAFLIISRGVDRRVVPESCRTPSKNGCKLLKTNDLPPPPPRRGPGTAS